ncbi:MAG: response regulator [Betaproteobacteria bacterium]|nr:response regulator [Betaproteobacteria bacterium]
MQLTPGYIKPRKADRALLVDDDPLMCEVSADILNELGIKDIMTAADGAEAAAIFDRAAIKPDLILCDLSMPRTDGFQFIGTLAKRRYLGGIIIISGQESRALTSASLIGQLQQLNILATIEKPVDKAALAAAVARFR